MRAACYIRQSSDQQTRSPEQQREACAALVKSKGWKHVAEFVDDAVSGDATEKRVGFQQMIAAAERGDFNVVAVWDCARFGRFDAAESGYWSHRLRQAGVTLWSVTEGRIDWSNSTDRLMSAFKAETNHAFLQTLANNVVRGRAAAARRGRVSGRTPFGFDRQYIDATGAVVKVVSFRQRFRRPKEWVERLIPSAEPGAVEELQNIFAQFIAGRPIRAIVRDLNARGVTTGTGGPWSPETVRKLLQNEAYAGRSAFGKKSRGRFSRTELIVDEASHEPLVSIPDWEKVQAIVAQRRERKVKPRESAFPLSGILTCSQCGGRMWGGHRGETRIYRCECFRRVQSDAVETAILDWLQDQVREEIKRFEESGHRQKTKPGTATRSMRRELHQLQTKIERGKVNILSADPEDVDDSRQVLRDWKNQAAELQRRIEEAEAGPPDVSDAVARLRRLDEIVSTRNPAEIRSLFASFMRKAVANFEKPEGSSKFQCVSVDITRTDGSVLSIPMG